MVENVDNEEGYAWIEAKGIWEISVPPPNFAMNLKLP